MRNKAKGGGDGETDGKGKDGRTQRTKICTDGRKRRVRERHMLETEKYLITKPITRRRVHVSPLTQPGPEQDRS